MSEATKRRRNRRTSGWADADVALSQELIAYWRARMDRLRVSDVRGELRKMSELALRRAAWLDQTEHITTLPPNYAMHVLRRSARHERSLAAHLRALEQKLSWCF